MINKHIPIHDIHVHTYMVFCRRVQHACLLEQIDWAECMQPVHVPVYMTKKGSFFLPAHAQLRPPLVAGRRWRLA